MELVYLWVEEYKNIKRQGFNFSSRFRCEFKAEYDENDELKEGCELEVIDKEEIGEDYIDIFPEKINVTVIVGENGSGKTSILEMLYLPHSQHQDTYKYIIFFVKEKEVHYYSSSKFIPTIETINFDKKVIHDIEMNEFNMQLISALSKPYDDRYVAQKIQKENEHFFGNMSYTQSIIIKALKLSEYDQELVFNGIGVKFLTLTLLIKKIYPTNRISEIDNLQTEHLFEKLNILINESNDNLSKFEKNFKLPKIEELIKQNILTAIFNIFIYIPEHRSKLEFLDWNYDEITYERLSSLFPEDDEIRLIIELARQFLEEHTYTFETIKKGSQEVYYSSSFDIKENINFLIEFIKKFSVFISRYSEHYFEFHMFDIDLFSEKKTSLNQHSDGEKALYSKIIDLEYEFLFTKENYFLLFDEPDNFLHPNWSKKIISIFLQSLSSKIDRKIHLIITTHSSFLLSDIPKENVIFLKKDEKTGQCINTTNDIDLNPFGANIHTLLSHGFFIKDGLMGEFAKNKIDKAIIYLNQKVLTKEEIDYCENIISIIGEPIIKRQLQKMLDSKRLSEIEVIKKQIEELQKELATKENKK